MLKVVEVVQFHEESRIGRWCSFGGRGGRVRRSWPIRRWTRLFEWMWMGIV